MANVKITDLTAYTDPVSTDVLPIVDVTNDVTKKVSIADVMENAGSGSLANCGIAFDGDPNTGLYRAGADQVAVVTGGTARLSATTTALTAALPVDHPLGTAGAPTVTFTGDLNTGIYSPGADQVAISTNGTGRLFVSSTGNIGAGAAPIACRLASSTADVGGTIGDTAQICTVNTNGAIGDFSGIRFNYFNDGGTGGKFAYIGSVLTSTATNGAADIVFGTRPTSTTTISERMRLDSSGGFQFKGAGTAGVTQAVSFNGSAPVNSLVIDSTGKVGLGTSTPGSVLDVQGTGTSPLARVTNTSSFTGGNNFTTPHLRIVNSNDVTSEVARLAYIVGNGGQVYLDSILENATTGYSSFSIRTRGADNLGERLRIDSSGRVGIGDNAPGSTLTVKGATGVTPLQVSGPSSEFCRVTSDGKLLVGTSSVSQDSTAVLQGRSSNSSASAVLRMNVGTATPANNDALGYLCFGDSSSSDAAYVWAQRDGGTWSGSSKPTRLVFSTCSDNAASPTERFKIDRNGNLRSFNVTGTNLVCVNDGASGTAVIYFQTSSVELGKITTNGSNAVTYATSSDYRLKENIIPLKNAVARLSQLKPSRFNFLNTPGQTVDGFIAHEAQAIVPECATGVKDEVDADGNPVYQGIDQSKLVPLLTAALQEALQKIEDLEGRLTAAGL